jgi:predicted peptidase
MTHFLSVCLLSLFLFCASAMNVSAQDFSQYEKHLYVAAAGDTLPYRLLKPLDYKEGKKYPLVVLLHGSGERGNDNEAQLIHGTYIFLEAANRKNYPCFVLVPQCPKNGQWASYRREGNKVSSLELTAEPTRPARLVDELMSQLSQKYSIDQNRLYITGISMGGFGTYDFITRQPGKFAAAAPVCGGGDTSQAGKIRKVPLWIFHGADDPVVPAALSRDMTAALRQAGGKPLYTEYPGVQHDSWTNAYAEPGLMKWMFSQKRKPQP